MFFWIPRIKCGAGSASAGMTIVKGFMTRYESITPFLFFLYSVKEAVQKDTSGAVHYTEQI